MSLREVIAQANVLEEEDCETAVRKLLGYPQFRRTLLSAFSALSPKESNTTASSLLTEMNIASHELNRVIAKSQRLQKNRVDGLLNENEKLRATLENVVLKARDRSKLVSKGQAMKEIKEHHVLTVQKIRYMLGFNEAYKAMLIKSTTGMNSGRDAFKAERSANIKNQRYLKARLLSAHRAIQRLKVWTILVNQKIQYFIHPLKERAGIMEKAVAERNRLEKDLAFMIKERDSYQFAALEAKNKQIMFIAKISAREQMMTKSALEILPRYRLLKQELTNALNCKMEETRQNAEMKIVIKDLIAIVVRTKGLIKHIYGKYSDCMTSDLTKMNYKERLHSLKLKSRDLSADLKASMCAFREQLIHAENSAIDAREFRTKSSAKIRDLVLCMRRLGLLKQTLLNWTHKFTREHIRTLRTKLGRFAEPLSSIDGKLRATEKSRDKLKLENLCLRTMLSKFLERGHYLQDQMMSINRVKFHATELRDQQVELAGKRLASVTHEKDTILSKLQATKLRLTCGEKVIKLLIEKFERFRGSQDRMAARCVGTQMKYKKNIIQTRECFAHVYQYMRPIDAAITRCKSSNLEQSIRNAKIQNTLGALQKRLIQLQSTSGYFKGLTLRVHHVKLDTIRVKKICKQQYQFLESIKVGTKNSRDVLLDLLSCVKKSIIRAETTSKPNHRVHLILNRLESGLENTHNQSKHVRSIFEDIQSQRNSNHDLIVIIRSQFIRLHELVGIGSNMQHRTILITSELEKYKAVHHMLLSTFRNTSAFTRTSSSKLMTYLETLRTRLENARSEGLRKTNLMSQYRQLTERIKERTKSKRMCGVAVNISALVRLQSLIYERCNSLHQYHSRLLAAGAMRRQFMEGTLDTIRGIHDQYKNYRLDLQHSIRRQAAKAQRLAEEKALLRGENMAIKMMRVKLVSEIYKFLSFFGRVSDNCRQNELKLPRLQHRLTMVRSRLSDMCAAEVRCKKYEQGKTESEIKSRAAQKAFNEKSSHLSHEKRVLTAWKSSFLQVSQYLDYLHKRVIGAAATPKLTLELKDKILCSREKTSTLYYGYRRLANLLVSSQREGLSKSPRTPPIPESSSFKNEMICHIRSIVREFHENSEGLAASKMRLNEAMKFVRESASHSQLIIKQRRALEPAPMTPKKHQILEFIKKIELASKTSRHRLLNLRVAIHAVPSSASRDIKLQDLAEENTRLSDLCKDLSKELSSTEVDLVQAYKFIRIKLGEDNLTELGSDSVTMKLQEELNWLRSFQASPVGSSLLTDAGHEEDTVGGEETTKPALKDKEPATTLRSHRKANRCYLIN